MLCSEVFCVLVQKCWAVRCALVCEVKCLCVGITELRHGRGHSDGSAAPGQEAVRDPRRGGDLCAGGRGSGAGDTLFECLAHQVSKCSLRGHRTPTLTDELRRLVANKLRNKQWRYRLKLENVTRGWRQAPSAMIGSSLMTYATPVNRCALGSK